MRILIIIAGVMVYGAAFVSLTSYQPAVEPVEPVKAVELPSKNIKELKTPEKTVNVTKVEKLDVVKDNPQDCDHETEWIWSDGSCHKKQGALNVDQPASNVAQEVSADCYAAELSKYSWDVATMQRIMRAESGCNPTNHNWADNHRTCKGSFGLLQIGCVHGYSVDYLSDPVNNIAAAYNVWQSQGYSAWTTW